jgi:hypothetical protein
MLRAAAFTRLWSSSLEPRKSHHGQLVSSQARAARWNPCDPLDGGCRGSPTYPVTAGVWEIDDITWASNWRVFGARYGGSAQDRCLIVR